MNPYSYRGYRYDTEIGMYYLQSRYYNPEWGRFINADSLGGKVGELLSHNMFAYSLNNPVNMEDESGNFPTLNQIFGFVVGNASQLLEIAGGAGMILGGLTAVASGNVLVGAVAIGFGLNHVISGYKDISNNYTGNKSQLGKNNIIKNQMQKALGDKNPQRRHIPAPCRFKDQRGYP
jgi:RHS repeat-associated protein